MPSYPPPTTNRAFARVAAGAQRPFAPTQETGHGLARVETAMWLLGITEDAVLDLIADGQLAAFDLRGAEAERRMPAIWSKSLRCQAAAPFYTSHFRPETQAVISDILPAGTRDLRFGALWRALGIKPFHAHNLLDAGLLRRVPGTGNDINKSSMITRASVVAFLTSRRM